METNETSRRNFLFNSVKTGIAFSAVGSILQSWSVTKPITGPGEFNTGFKQEPLPYAYTALESAIDATTMEIHYTRHAASYATSLQDAAKAEGVDMNRPLEDALAKISKYSAKMRNNGGGHYNHEMFWKCMAPKTGGKPSGKLLKGIEESFNSFDSFKTQFGDAGKNRFGSGWAWLFVDKDKKLRIGSTPNQDNLLMDISDLKGFPVLGLDVWEHAYYLRYQNKRADYINNWWNVVNWEYVQDRYQSAM